MRLIQPQMGGSPYPWPDTVHQFYDTYEWSYGAMSNEALIVHLPEPSHFGSSISGLIHNHCCSGGIHFPISSILRFFESCTSFDWAVRVDEGRSKNEGSPYLYVLDRHGASLWLGWACTETSIHIAPV
jgi:hypothetical protein